MRERRPFECRAPDACPCKRRRTDDDDPPISRGIFLWPVGIVVLALLAAAAYVL